MNYGFNQLVRNANLLPNIILLPMYNNNSCKFIVSSTIFFFCSDFLNSYTVVIDSVGVHSGIIEGLLNSTYFGYYYIIYVLVV